MVEELIGITLIIGSGCAIFALLDWTSWNPPKWVVKVKMWRKR